MGVRRIQCSSGFIEMLLIHGVAAGAVTLGIPSDLQVLRGLARAKYATGTSEISPGFYIR